MPNVVAEHIAVTPGVCGGRPRIAGTRIRVQDVAVLHERLGKTADEIVAAYPSLGLADVHAALAYYFDHRDDVRRMIAEDEAAAEAARASTPSKLADLRP
ncbi:MAG TPA: DUF433 domain-containing protein [Planctomycetaceae bacterium]